MKCCYHNTRLVHNRIPMQIYQGIDNSKWLIRGYSSDMKDNTSMPDMDLGFGVSPIIAQDPLIIESSVKICQGVDTSIG